MLYHKLHWGPKGGAGIFTGGGPLTSSEPPLQLTEPNVTCHDVRNNCVSQEIARPFIRSHLITPPQMRSTEFRNA